MKVYQLSDSDITDPKIEKGHGLFLEKHECCLSCPYNKNQNVEGASVFSCAATVEEFPCVHIPDLYPEKLAAFPDNAGVYPEDRSDCMDASSLSLFDVTLMDVVNEATKQVLIVGNTVDSVKELMSKKLNHPVYSHLVLLKVKPLKELQGFDILVAPKDVTKIFYPEVVVDIQDRPKIKLDAVQMEVHRKASLTKEHGLDNTKLKILGGYNDEHKDSSG
jgi:hypothetical protein